MLRNPAYKGVLNFNRRTNSKWHRFLGGVNGRSVERQDEGLEKRDKADWIIVENAWPALVDADTFDKVQARLDQVRKEHLHVTGQSVRQGYLLTGGILRCGICGGNLIGQTEKLKKANGSIRLWKRYICGTHHKGNVDQCPQRYGVPVDVVEEKVWSYIQRDLWHLQGDAALCRQVEAELAKACGTKADARKALQTRLSDLDGQIGKLTTHLSVLDVQTATTLGLYVKAKTLADERQQVQARLAECDQAAPEMPSPAEIAQRAAKELANVRALLESGSLEQKRELVRAYVKGMKVDPMAKEVELSIMPALFSWIGTGGWRSGGSILPRVPQCGIVGNWAAWNRICGCWAMEERMVRDAVTTKHEGMKRTKTHEEVLPRSVAGGVRDAVITKHEATKLTK